MIIQMLYFTFTYIRLNVFHMCIICTAYTVPSDKDTSLPALSLPLGFLQSFPAETENIPH